MNHNIDQFLSCLLNPVQSGKHWGLRVPQIMVWRWGLLSIWTFLKITCNTYQKKTLVPGVTNSKISKAVILANNTDIIVVGTFITLVVDTEASKNEDNDKQEIPMNKNKPNTERPVARTNWGWVSRTATGITRLTGLLGVNRRPWIQIRPWACRGIWGEWSSSRRSRGFGRIWGRRIGRQVRGHFLQLKIL